MFFTGAFKFEGVIINTYQRSHDKEEYDDQRFDNGLLEDPDGFVTNEGNIITIHIKIMHDTPDKINLIKRSFSLNDDQLNVKISYLFRMII